MSISGLLMFFLEMIFNAMIIFREFFNSDKYVNVSLGQLA